MGLCLMVLASIEQKLDILNLSFSGILLQYDVSFGKYIETGRHIERFNLDVV